MSNPKLENGYIRIANELYEALCRANMSASELRITHLIIRYTYGFNQKETAITNQQIADQTGIAYRTITGVIPDLVKNNVLIANNRGNKRYLSLNKNYEIWASYPQKFSTINAEVTQNHVPYAKSRTQNSVPPYAKSRTPYTQKSVPLIKYKDNTYKDNIYKDIVISNKDINKTDMAGNIIPTEDDVLTFALDKKLDIGEIEDFIEYYNERRWVINGEPVRNWQGLFISWCNNTVI